MTREQYIAGLRKLADLYEQHHELPLETIKDYALSISLWIGDDNGIREKIAATARVLGKTEKLYDQSFFRLRGEISPGFVLEYIAFRSSVCRKVKVMKEVEEWKCDDPLLAET